MAQDGPKDPLHIIPIYMSPLITNDSLSGPLPHWFHAILTGPNPQFLVMLKHAHHFEDWGVAVELDCFQYYDNKIHTINTKIQQLQLDATMTEHDCTLCKQ
jgi:hypothetical protein